MADVFMVSRGGYQAKKGQRKSAQDKLLSETELGSLLAAALKDRRRYGWDGYDLFVVSGNFGLRCSECLGLTFDDFKSLDHGYFRVSTLKKRAEGHDRVYTGSAGRAVMEKILEKRRKVSANHLFPFTDRTARYLFGYYAEKAGISPNVSFHSLRHTAAKMLLEAIGGKIDYPERIVNAFLRHKPTTTEIYLTPSAQEMTQAMDLKGCIA